MRALFLMTLLTSCGYASDYVTTTLGREPRFKGVDPILQPYVDQFNRDCGVPVGVVIPTGFAKLDGPAGQCNEWRVGVNDYEEITIDPDKWARMNDWHRKWLLKHELGHCLLNRDHNNDYLEPNVPVSVMIDTVPPNAAELWRTRSQYYINELCGEQHD